MISLTRDGRRTYITGDTYSHKSAIKAAGAHWDSDRRAWWIGDHAKAEALVASIEAAPPPVPEVNYAKLPDGSWGIKGKGLTVGAAVTVVRKDGTKSEETVKDIVRTDADGFVFASVVPKPKTAGSTGQRRTYTHCSQCGVRNERPSRYSTCWDCKTVMDEDMGIYR